MKRLDLQKCIVGSVFTNCYFLKNKETEEMLIVDPGDNADRIEQKVLEMQGRKSFSESISYAGKTGGDPSDTWSF